MKRFIRVALAVALLEPGMAVLSARAQNDAPLPKNGGQPGVGKPTDSTHHDGAGRGGDNLAQMKMRLGLTDEQARKLKDVVKAHMEANTPFNEHLRTETKVLYDQRKKKASSDDIQRTLDSLNLARKGMTAENERFRKSLASFLSATQLAKLRAGMQEDMRGGRGGHR